MNPLPRTAACAEAICPASAAGDDSGVHAIADQGHVPRIPAQDDELLIHVLQCSFFLPAYAPIPLPLVLASFLCELESWIG